MLKTVSKKKKTKHFRKDKTNHYDNKINGTPFNKE